MPIWFHSLTILPGSAAGAAALNNDHTCHFRPKKSYAFVQVLRKPLERAAGIFFAALAAHRRDCVPSKMLGQPQNSQHGGMAAWHLMNGLGKGF
jgi:hypothetical protein